MAELETNATASSTGEEPQGVFETLDVELKTFREKREELLGEGIGRHVLIKGDLVVCTMDTQSDAINTGYKEFGNVPFLVAEILPLDTPTTFMTPTLGR